MPRQDHVAAVRRFNRFYTRQIGVLRKTYLDSPYSLGEMRVLYEVAHGATTARDIGRALDLDAGYLSRTLRAFEKRGFLSRKTSKADARASELAITARGRKAFAPFEQRSRDQAGDILSKLSTDQRKRLTAAMSEIETILGETAPAERRYTLREPKIGDYGWIVTRHGELYAEEFGWGEPFEGLVAGIVADFAKEHDPKRERCWIAEMDGENVGCIFLVRDSDEVARIRLLLVDAKARGLHLGQRLVDECIGFAREAGYRRITLWTHAELVTARGIYAKRGFTLTSSETKRSFGKDVVSEHWDLNL
jgi:DNA-binding MarR family transcriptional regulator/N-acetylglutamate synthase-like GNAT family acetyltransferase